MIATARSKPDAICFLRSRVYRRNYCIEFDCCGTRERVKWTGRLLRNRRRYDAQESCSPGPKVRLAPCSRVRFERFCQGRHTIRGHDIRSVSTERRSKRTAFFAKGADRLVKRTVDVMLVLVSEIAGRPRNQPES